MAAMAARRRGLRDHRLSLRRIRGAIGAQLARRLLTHLLAIAIVLTVEALHSMIPREQHGQHVYTRTRIICMVIVVIMRMIEANAGDDDYEDVDYATYIRRRVVSLTYAMFICG